MFDSSIDNTVHPGSSAMSNGASAFSCSNCGASAVDVPEPIVQSNLSANNNDLMRPLDVGCHDQLVSTVEQLVAHVYLEVERLRNTLDHAITRR